MSTVKNIDFTVKNETTFILNTVKFILVSK